MIVEKDFKDVLQDAHNKVLLDRMIPFVKTEFYSFLKNGRNWNNKLCGDEIKKCNLHDARYYQGQRDAYGAALEMLEEFKQELGL